MAIQQQEARRIDMSPRSSIETIELKTDDQGVEWRFVRVPDISDYSPTGEALRSKIAGFNAELIRHPEWEAPRVTIDGRTGVKTLHADNPVSEELYALPGMKEWREQLVPSAMALYPLQRPESLDLPSGGLIDQETREYFINAYDAVGIRRRAAIMGDIARRHTGLPDTVTSWVSLACGAAVPVLDSVCNNQDEDPAVHLDLVDADPRALQFAEMLATDQGLKEGEGFTLLQRNLLRGMVFGDGLVQEIGPHQADMVDALGITEYFNDRACVPFLRNAYALVKPGGALVAANMLDTHPELAFNQRGVGWPKIYPRSPGKIVELVAAAGIPLDMATVTVSEDGVYAVIEMKR